MAKNHYQSDFPAESEGWRASTVLSPLSMDIDELFFKYAVYLPVTALRGQRVRTYLRQLEGTERLPAEQLRSLQLQRLRDLVAIAKATVPHYAEALASTPDRALTMDDVRQLPFVDKPLLKANRDSFRARNPPARSVFKTSGGSTGQPLTILKSPDAMAHELAATWRGYHWAGIGMGARQARFWGVPFTESDRLRARLIDFVCNRRRCSAFAFDARSLAEYERGLVRFRPTYFYGYVSMLVAFANYYRERGGRPPFRLRCIITTSEVLTASDRGLLEDVFETRVFNEYGCGELGTIAHECDRGSLHINDENMIVEVMDGERRCAPGEKGELVVTELHNVAMPLIRYRTGDFGSVSDRPCRCGRTLTVLEHVFGRAYDFVVTSDGRRFHGEFLMYVFEEAQRHQLGIAQFQVQQKTVTDFIVRIIPGPGFVEASKELILARMHQYLGRDIRVIFETVGSIPREASGKMRVIIGMTGASGSADGPDARPGAPMFGVGRP
jgi:phenylacetate-CoA ligase